MSVDDISIPEEEKIAAVNLINQLLNGDPDLQGVLPIDPSGKDIFEVVYDGILLCKLLNLAKQDAIDVRILNRNKGNLDSFKISQNQNLLINSAKAVGCSIGNVKPKEVLEKPTLVFLLIWQILKLILFSRISIIHHPELFLLLQIGEDVADLRRLSSEQVLLRWFNFFLARANPGFSRRVANFGSDLKDCCCYTVLLATIAPEYFDLEPLREPDLVKRAEIVLDYAEALHFERFLTPQDIASGNERLNMAFTAMLFMAWGQLTLPAILSLKKFSDLRDLPLIHPPPDTDGGGAGSGSDESSGSSSSASGKG